MDYIRHTFRAMGTSVTMLAPWMSVGEHERACRRVEAIFSVEEERFSRFRGTSELTRVNRAAGTWTPVSARFEELARLALSQAERTQGLFDPTVLGAVIAAGYDRDFDEVLAGARVALQPAPACGRWADVEVKEGAIRLPAGIGLDLGGIAKGFTSDIAAEAVVTEGLPWVLVSAGGDLRLFGDAPAIDVGIEEPLDPQTSSARVALREGALATSSVVARAWGDGLHHVIDPRTGVPSLTDALQATVWAPTCAEAEVLATWALLSGSDAAATYPCAIATVDGRLLMSFPQGVAA